MRREIAGVMRGPEAAIGSPSACPIAENPGLLLVTTFRFGRARFGQNNAARASSGKERRFIAMRRPKQTVGRRLLSPPTLAGGRHRPDSSTKRERRSFANSIPISSIGGGCHRPGNRSCDGRCDIDKRYARLSDPASSSAATRSWYSETAH